VTTVVDACRLGQVDDDNMSVALCDEPLPQGPGLIADSTSLGHHQSQDWSGRVLDQGREGGTNEWLVRAKQVESGLGQRAASLAKRQHQRDRGDGE